MEENVLFLIMDIYGKPKVNIILKGEEALKAFTQRQITLLIWLFNIVLDIGKAAVNSIEQDEQAPISQKI